MKLGLDGQYILVTGSSKGIGRGIAEAFLRENAKVILTGRQKTILHATMQELADSFSQESVLSFAGDLSQGSVAQDLAEFIENKVGQLDHLVCNIGSGASVPPLQEDTKEFQRMLDINLLSAVTAIKAMLPLLIKSAEQGNSTSVVLIGSICGVEALGCPAAYAASKAALEAYAKNITRPLADSGIRINVVSPGNIIFPGSTWERKMVENSDAVAAMLDKEVPLKRLGTVDEVANIVAFLASEKAAFVTGANWIVDGGQTR